MTILDTIMTKKREEVSDKRRRCSLAQLQTQVGELAGGTRNFKAAIAARIDQQQPAIIAEIKKASPSKGVIRADFNVAQLAKSYAKGGATCLSILTDQPFFQGHDDFLGQAREAVSLPLLRKDFIFDAYQVWESRLLGADCILLIKAVLSADQINTLAGLALELDMSVLIEVHDQAELKALPPLQEHCLLGINNRDLHSFEVDIDTAVRLKAQADTPYLIAESGIQTPAQVAYLLKQQIYGFLIGETFMRYQDPELGMATLFPTVP